MKRTCRGWSSGGFSVEHRNVDVQVRDVCTCSWRKECSARKRCRSLFESGGEWGAHRQLARFMGLRKVPKRWNDWRNQKAWQERQDNMDKFRKEFFRRCRPVRVTVETA